jgi:dUTP pyrophosphatase
MTTLKLKLLDTELIPLYKKRVNTDGDAGVDLYFPEEVTIPGKTYGHVIDLKIKGEMVQSVSNHLTDNIPKEMLTGMLNISDRYLSYMVTPRSSISKTPLRMSNSVGIMDSGYRGEIKVPVDNFSNDEYIIEKHSRLFQVINSTLDEIELQIVNNLSDSVRGSGGFGSTGV